VTRFITEIIGGGAAALQRGAIVRRPTLVLAGEAGPEAIVPLRAPFLQPVAPVINISITGNYILDDRTAQNLADRVSEALLRRLRARHSLSLR